MIIYGINSVREALRAGRVQRLLIGSRSDARVRAIVEQATGKNIEVATASPQELERRSGGGVHQDVMAEVRDDRTWTLGQLVQSAADIPLIVVLDGIEDPHNVGAILRSCDAAGVDGVVRQTRRAAALTGVAARTSAGALAHVRIADVVNIARAISELKALGVWTIGLDAAATKTPYDVDLTAPTAFVLGAEGSGLRRLVRESCDWLVRIPMVGHVESLNVSVAAGVVLFETRRQRALKKP